MREILHILTKRDDAVAKAIIEQERNLRDVKIDAIDLTAKDADYDALVKKIFSADAVHVW